jgi:hypothetical protein
VAWIDKRTTSKGEVRYLVGFREPGTGKRVHESFHLFEDARHRKTEIERQTRAPRLREAGAEIPWPRHGQSDARHVRGALAG